MLSASSALFDPPFNFAPHITIPLPRCIWNFHDPDFAIPFPLLAWMEKELERPKPRRAWAELPFDPIFIESTRNLLTTMNEPSQIDQINFCDVAAATAACMLLLSASAIASSSVDLSCSDIDSRSDGGRARKPRGKPKSSMPIDKPSQTLGRDAHDQKRRRKRADWRAAE